MAMAMAMAMRLFVVALVCCLLGVLAVEDTLVASTTPLVVDISAALDSVKTSAAAGAGPSAEEIGAGLLQELNGVADQPNVDCVFSGVNLAPLTKASGDYVGKDDTYTYKMNVCGNSNAGTGCTDRGYAICQYLDTTFVASLGKFAGAQPGWRYIDSATPAKGVQYGFTNGDQCWIAGAMKDRVVNVLFPCTPSEKAPTAITVTEDKATCVFTITLKTAQSCPGGAGSLDEPSGGLSGGSVFVILFFVLVPVYIVGGCVYKNKKLGTTGRESCPNIDLWSQIPPLVMDGCRYSLMMVKTGCKGSRSYSQV